MSDPADDTTPRALVAGHADFAVGLVSAVEAISGCGALLVPIQARGLSGEDIERLLGDSLRQHGIRVLFTDLQAGSCTMAARRVMRATPGVTLVAGANLPMLLDFVLSRNPDPSLAAAQAAERGRAAITVLVGASA